MIRFNRDAERKLKEDLANIGKPIQGYNIYATVKGSANHRRIGTLDPQRTAITFDGTNNLAPIVKKAELEDGAVVGDVALVPIPVETIQSAAGRLSETRRGKAKSGILSSIKTLIQRGVKTNPTKDPLRVIEEKDREIGLLMKQSNEMRFQKDNEIMMLKNRLALQKPLAEDIEKQRLKKMLG